MIVRLYTGDDGQSHFEELNIPGGDAEDVPLRPGAEIIFTREPDGRFHDWHNAPRRQFVITLSGQVEIVIGDGTAKRLGPGDVLLAEDLTGRGHTSRAVGARTGVSVPLPD